MPAGPDAPPARDDDDDPLEDVEGPKLEERALVIAVPRVPGGLDPFSELDPWARRIVDDLVFEGMTRRGGDEWPFVEPALADRCIAVPQDKPRDLYCHIAPGATFHDGTEVAMGDVEFSLRYWLDPRRGGLRLRHGLDALSKIEIVDYPRDGSGRDAMDPGRWVRIGFSRSEPLCRELIAAMKVVPEKARRGKTRAFALEPIGTGPMKVAAYDTDRLVLQRVGAATADDALDRIVLQGLPDGAASLTLLRRGEVHWLAEVAPSHVPQELTKAGTAPRFSAWAVSPPRYDILFYNVRRGPQAGPRLRAALDAAIPRGAIGKLQRHKALQRTAPVDTDDPIEIDLLALAEAGVSARWGMAGLPEPASVDDELQRVTAGSQLDGLGWPLERGMRRRATGSLRIVLTRDGAGGLTSQTSGLLRDAWREVGVNVPQATASWAYISGLIRRGDFDVALARLAVHSDDDLYRYFHSRGELNVTGVADAELDQALGQYREARTREERTQARARVSARLTALGVVSVLYAPLHVTLVSRRVRNVEFIDDLPRLDTLRLGPESTWIRG